MSGPSGFGACAYLYVGTNDVSASLDFYQRGLGADLVWRFHAFGTDVAAVRVTGGGPLLLLAGHRPVPSCLPIWTVPDLEPVVERLQTEGFAPGDAVGTPDGPIQVLTDPSGNEIGLLRPDRPGALEQAYADPSNTNAVR
jgi:catechol 2,3-dioxygenase-like lactoylglutathione lyase family enzyme